jgi:hypothetical protein
MSIWGRHRLSVGETRPEPNRNSWNPLPKIPTRPIDNHSASGPLGRAFVSGLARGPPVSGAELMVEGGHRIAVDGIGHKKGCWPKRSCDGAGVVSCGRSVPDQDRVLPVGSGRWGGALG